MVWVEAVVVVVLVLPWSALGGLAGCGGAAGVVTDTPANLDMKDCSTAVSVM